jgi:hypothetical protein
MNRPRSNLAGSAALLAIALAAACSPPPPISPQDRADRQTQAACRERADQVYAQQNRGAIYAQQDDRLSPFSGSYSPGVTSRGLGERYGRDMMISDCVRNAQGQTPDRGAGPTMEPTAHSSGGPGSP